MSEKKEISKIEILYALRHIKSGELLSMETRSNNGSEFCNDRTVQLTHCSYDYDEFNPDIWYIDSATNAEYVRQFPTEWYNSSERTPLHHYEPDELEVVEIRREIKSLTKKVSVPTYLEYMELKYKEKNPEHYEDVVRSYNERKYTKWNYSLWELLELVEDGLWKPDEGELNG